MEVQHDRPGDEERDDVQEVQDERVGERVRLGDVVRGEGDDGGRLEDAEPRGSGGDDEREARGDDDEQAGAEGQVEVEAEGHEPEREREQDPGDDREHEAHSAEMGAAQAGEALGEVDDADLDPARVQEREP